jgi:hypothetical protein
MPPVSKKHLQFAAWPDEDRALWLAAFKQGDVFDEGRTSYGIRAVLRVSRFE